MSKSIEFLRNLAQQLQTQDNAYTASPNYCIQERVLICGIDEDYGGKVGWFAEEATEPLDESTRKYRALERYYDQHNKEPDGWTRCGYEFSWRYTGMSFLTHEAAHAYVSQCGYRHDYPIRVYVDSHYRNHEMREVRRLLAGPVANCIESLTELTGAILECECDDSKNLADTITAEIEQRACDALAALDTAKEPHQ